MAQEPQESEARPKPAAQEPSVPEELSSKLLWFVILVPGFFALFLATSLAGMGIGEEFEATLKSLLLSALVATLAVASASYFVKRKRSRSWHWTFGVSTAFWSVVLGILLGLALQNDWLYLALSRIPYVQVNKVTEARPLYYLLKENSISNFNTAGDNRWIDESNKETDAWVSIVTTEGKEFEGWPYLFAVGQDESQIYLSPACKIGSDLAAATSPILGPGILIYERQIATVTFLDRSTSACYKALDK